jgi:hypothetical protein
MACIVEPLADQTSILSIIGGVTGPLGFVISLLVYFRDRARVKVNVTWDMVTMPRDPRFPERFVKVSVANVGRRPIHVSSICARIVGEEMIWLLATGIDGKTLAEGSAPYDAIADEKMFRDKGTEWWKIRFSVTDSSGKVYLSDWPMKAPKWAEKQLLPWYAKQSNRARNRLRRLLIG